MSNDTPEYLLWLDFETTGLDETDVPIEVAAVITTADTLEELDGYRALILADPAMVATCAAHDMHEASGLLPEWLDAAKEWNSNRPRVPMQGIGWTDTYLCQLLNHLGIEVATLAGSGVATFDLQIIKRLMPGLTARLTYHVHDVGVMRRAYRRATGHDLTPRTEPAHRAMADVQQSLTEGRAFADLFRAKAE